MTENRKTGLTVKVRALLRYASRAMTPTGICEALDIPKGLPREAVWNVLKDLKKRGEIQRTEKGRFRYNHDYGKPVGGALKQVVMKAVYVSISGFSASDIQRLSGVGDKHYIQKIMRKLIADGYLVQVGRRKCDHGNSIERVFTIVDRAKFRLDLVG